MGTHSVGIARIALGDVGLVSLQIQVVSARRIPVMCLCQRNQYGRESWAIVPTIPLPMATVLLFQLVTITSGLSSPCIAATIVQYNHNQTVPNYIHLVTKDQWEWPLDQHLLHH